MDKRKFLRTVIELGKDVLIIGLTCSALWMLRGGGLWQRVALVDNQTPGITEQQASAEDRAAAARPMSITATIQGGIQPERCVIRYDDSGVDTLFRQLDSSRFDIHFIVFIILQFLDKTVSLQVQVGCLLHTA